MDWSDLEKNIAEFNAMLGLEKAEKAPRASAQAYPELRGVHTASPGSHEPGRSQAGLMSRIGAHPKAKEQHQAVIREQRKIKPKLPA
jgi:hypothetical protein